MTLGTIIRKCSKQFTIDTVQKYMQELNFRKFLQSFHLSNLKFLLIKTYYMNLNVTKCTFGHSDITSRERQKGRKIM